MVAGWSPRTSFRELVSEMVAADLALLGGGRNSLPELSKVLEPEPERVLATV